MKELTLQQMSAVEGGNDVTDFLDGVACGYGLATIATGFGALLAVYGCGRALGIF